MIKRNLLGKRAIFQFSSRSADSRWNRSINGSRNRDKIYGRARVVNTSRKLGRKSSTGCETNSVRSRPTYTHASPINRPIITEEPLPRLVADGVARVELGCITTIATQEFVKFSNLSRTKPFFRNFTTNRFYVS